MIFQIDHVGGRQVRYPSKADMQTFTHMEKLYKEAGGPVFVVAIDDKYLSPIYSEDFEAIKMN